MPEQTENTPTPESSGNLREQIRQRLLADPNKDKILANYKRRAEQGVAQKQQVEISPEHPTPSKKTEPQQAIIRKGVTQEEMSLVVNQHLLPSLIDTDFDKYFPLIF